MSPTNRDAASAVIFKQRLEFNSGGGPAFIIKAQFGVEFRVGFISFVLARWKMGLEMERVPAAAARAFAAKRSPLSPFRD